MSALPLRRALLLILLLALLLGGCNAGQGKPGVPAGLGDTNPAAGEPPEPATGLPRCTEDLIVKGMFYDGLICAGSGSECTIEGGWLVPWVEGGPLSPELTWTYPCAVDEFLVTLEQPIPASGSVTLMSMEVSGDAATRPTHTWDPSFILPERGTYSYHIIAHAGDLIMSGTKSFRVDNPCEGLSDAPPGSLSPDHGEVVSLDQLAPERFTYFSAGAIVGEGGGVAVWAECGFEWEQGESPDCIIPAEAEVSSDSTFTTGVMPMEGCVIHGVVETCHTYYWRVREYVPGQVGPWSGVASFRSAPPEGWDTCYELPRESTPIEAVATQNAACRLGPSTAYGIAGYAAAGERRMIVGRNAAGTWLQTAEGCYINSGLLLVEVVQGTLFPQGADVGSLMSLIPEVPDPPLPTPTESCWAAMTPGECAAIGRPYNYDLNKCVCP